MRPARTAGGLGSLARLARRVWTGAGGPTPLAGRDRVGRHDERPPPAPICETCHRRFCRCVDKPPTEPPAPGAEDCCQSSPQCKFCVWLVYEENVAEYQAYLATKNDGR